MHGGQAVFATLFCALPVLLGAALPLAVLINYAWQFGDPLVKTAFAGFVVNSVSVAGSAALIAVSIAVMLSYAQQYSNNQATRFSIQIATLGYALPGIMLAIGLLAPISRLDIWLAEFLNANWQWQTGLILTGTAVTLVYAYVVRFLTVAFNSTSSSLARIPLLYNQAARSLGATPMRLFSQIHLPLMRSSVFHRIYSGFCRYHARTAGDSNSAAL